MPQIFLSLAQTFLLLLLLPVALFGQVTGSISGIIINQQGNPVGFANIGVKGTSLGTASDKDGKFILSELPIQRMAIVVSAVGYQRLEKVVTVKQGISALGQLSLTDDLLGLDEVVVTGTMSETFVGSSPVKVDVISSQYLQKYTASNNIVEGVSLVNGVQEVVSCGVCFTNSISINGLEGPNTAVLMDGSPIYGNLASVYGLNGIPTMIIDRFEIIKGPNSTLYGSEAVAGVINIITKDPSKQALVSLDIKGTSHLESFTNVSFSPKAGKFNAFIGLNYVNATPYEDFNNDGFGDIINTDQLSVFTKWSMNRESGKKFTLSAKYYYEDRRNGVRRFLENRAYRTLRGNDLYYGESIYTNRMEAFGSYELKSKENLKLDYSFSYHHQDSYYGTDYYKAEQTIGFTNFTWGETIKNHQVLVGVTNRFQQYDDNTVATQTTSQGQNQYTPGIFVQDEWTTAKKITLLPGIRLDYYHEHGFVTAPRLSIKYKLGDWTTVRSNFGTGFRVVNLFTEDHAFVTGQRSVEIAEALAPEQSQNITVNFNHVYTVGSSQGMMDIDLFYTHFDNKIVPDYNTPGKIIYTNAVGNAISKGIGANLSHQFRFPLSVNIGINLMETTRSEADDQGLLVKAPIEFAPRWTGISTVNYEIKRKGISLAYTLNHTGKMALPKVYDLDNNGVPLAVHRATTSKPFSQHNFQITKKFRNSGFEVYLGVENLFDFKQQSSPLSGFNDPNSSPGFSEFFDTAYAYAPIHGRETYLGVRWKMRK